MEVHQGDATRHRRNPTLAFALEWPALYRRKNGRRVVKSIGASKGRILKKE
jgi:hypothetical protein